MATPPEDRPDTDFQLLGLPTVSEDDALRAQAPFDLLASQFVDELRQGGRPSVERYARRFPPHAARIRDVFPVLELLEHARLERESRALRRNMPGAFPFTRLGQCELLHEIGRGGMGVVFRARDLASGHLVALKVLPWPVTLAASWVSRFEQEASLARQLQHPNIIPVFRWGQDNGYCFFVMQLIPGIGLDTVIEALGRSPAATSLEQLIPATGIQPSAPTAPPLMLTSTSCMEFARIAIQAAQALRAAHAAGICHNDIKPANLLLDVAGHVWVADFGLSQQLQPGAVSPVTAPAAPPNSKHSSIATARTASSPGAAFRGGGTLRYMAPERFSGTQSPAADVYALGATLYELSLQCAPFSDEDPRALRSQILTQPPLPPRDLCREFPRGLETIILNCLQKNPQDRYPTAESLLQDLLRFTHGHHIRSTRRSRLTGLLRWSGLSSGLP
ncbi:MAG: serine/threonine-protein kinase [Planctomycetota bacterium]